MELESVLSHIKDNPIVPPVFSLQDLEKVPIKSGIVASAHNLLKAARTRLAAFLLKKSVQKKLNGKQAVPHPIFGTH
ncbi:hypothetical protein QNH46_00840 [Paenibacillus woosongensis]|uniref:Uncharacterized protein n=1 Tax=Paenibacillus woosongensis TaxID=307580 RepID=A0AA95L297_9BACL|nr:hypothetical protein [Paenibacillus woosongensis]WHX49272.1 hypothetical protein QNH46_00840 [Paenibacillus woosongensis]